MYAKHFSEAMAGVVFSQSVTPLGLAIPIYTATAIGGAGICALPLWNPPNSNVLVEVVRVELNRASGTADFGAVGVMAVSLQAVASGTPCTALASTDPINGYLFAGRKSKVTSNNGAGTCTVTAGTTTPSATAPGWVRSLASINLEADTATAHATATATYDFDGTLLVPPGVLIYFACTKASLALYASGLIWKEWAINR